MKSVRPAGRSTPSTRRSTTRKFGISASRRTCAENRHIRLVGQPVTLSRTPSKMVARPPEFGEQTDEVLAEFGFTADKIAELRQPKLVRGCGLQRANVQLSRALCSNLLAAAPPLHSPALDL